MLAIGIGANSTLFSIVNAVLIHPLPYPEPERLVAVHASKPNFEEGSISYPNFRDWQKENHTLAALAVARSTSFTASARGDTERVRGTYISSDYFPILGVQPVAGRLFATGEDEIGRAPVALVSAGFSQRKFRDPQAAIGKTLNLDGRTFTIIGVIPGNFNLPLRSFRTSDVYLPIGEWQTEGLKLRAAGLGIHGIARLKPGVTLEQARADMSGVSKNLAATYPQEDHGLEAHLVSLRRDMLGDIQPFLLILLAAVGFVLLIACVNVANLLLARSSARAHEFGVRYALGASRRRIISQVLTESTMLSIAGGGLGLSIALWGTSAALKLAPVGLPRGAEVHLSPAVVIFNAVISVGTGILFGLLPALKIARYQLQDTLRESGRGINGMRGGAQSWLVIFEMAAALVLLAGAGLMVRSLMALSQVDPGFRAHGILSFSLSAPYSSKNSTPEAARTYVEQLDHTLARIPGVKAVSTSWDAFPLGDDDEEFFWLPSEPKPANSNDMHWAVRYRVEPDFLKVMGIQLERGRFFTHADRDTAPHVAVIDEKLARKYFGASDPIGQQLFLNGENGDNEKVTIVGEVRHVMQWGVAEDSTNELQAQIYLPLAQLTDAQWVSVDGLRPDVALRADDARAETIFTDIQQTMREMDRTAVVYGPETMDQAIAKSLGTRRFLMILLSIFAGIALLLACVGVYGVLSHLVGQRTQEIAIRMALGADQGSVLGWVMEHALKLSAIGAGAGVAGALLLSGMLARASIFYGVRFYDPWTLFSVMLLLLLVVALAAYVPARRATRVDPMHTLRTG
jgi:predicted permease